MKIQVCIKAGSPESEKFSIKIMRELWKNREIYGSQCGEGLDIHVIGLTKDSEMITFESSDLDPYLKVLIGYGLVKIPQVGPTTIFVQKTGDKWWLEKVLRCCPNLMLDPDYSKLLIEVEGQDEIS
ncbi:MAG: hypothetical protein WCP93_03505 [Candidatus Berkelbacteria bacterium]